MSKPIIASLILSTLLLAACQTGTEMRAKNAGKILAETACMGLSGSQSLIEDAEALLPKYGFSGNEEFEAYLEEIEGTEDANIMAVTIREHAQESCGDLIEELGLNPADLAETLMP